MVNDMGKGCEIMGKGPIFHSASLQADLFVQMWSV